MSATRRSVLRPTRSWKEMREMRMMRKPRPKMPKAPKVSTKPPDHERITVCVLDSLTGTHTFVEGVRDDLASSCKLINGGHIIPRKHLHVMPVTVGVDPAQRKVYGFLYADRKSPTEDDETLVMRTTDVNGKDIFYGMPCGPAVIFTFDNRRLNKPTRPGTLTEEDKEFLRGHIFAKDGHVFLMAEARKEY